MDENNHRPQQGLPMDGLSGMGRFICRVFSVF